MTEPLKTLADAGVSIWLDDLSRERLDSGNLAKLIKDFQVVGVTTNPTIFAAALAKGSAYDQQVKELVDTGASIDEAILEITTTDVRNACDLFGDVHQATDGVDGRVSIEVSPGVAHDTEGTIAEAKKLAAKVDRPNTFIKIPATLAGLPAITAVIAEGISVNVTLIFGIERYKAVMDAYFAGLEQAAEKGIDLSGIQSVASFFVSRVDTEYDKRLEEIGTDEAKSLQSKAAIANARLAYAAYEEAFATDRWKALEAKGAQVQRPLWASTGVKNPDLPDTLYVTELVVAGTVNTMPEKTLNAVADHGRIEGDKVTGSAADAQSIMDSLAGLGIDYDDVIATLEREGVEKFAKSWDELVETVEGQLKAASDS